jgi:hypothetical protein
VTLRERQDNRTTNTVHTILMRDWQLHFRGPVPGARANRALIDCRAETEEKHRRLERAGKSRCPTSARAQLADLIPRNANDDIGYVGIRQQIALALLQERLRRPLSKLGGTD